MLSKKCSKCGKLLPFSHFHKDVQKKDNLSCRCVFCRKFDRRLYYLNNIDKTKEQGASYYKLNKKKVNIRLKNYYLNNKEDYYYRSAKRRAAKLQRTPKWADTDGIRFFYYCCPKGCHVDHIIPLQGKEVSGFHILVNLQYLTAEENYKKGNKYE